MALLAASAFAPVGDHDLSRSISGTVRHQFLMVQGKFDPGGAAVAINKAIQAGRKSKPSPDWDKTTRTTYGLFSAVPMNSNSNSNGHELT